MDLQTIPISEVVFPKQGHVSGLSESEIYKKVTFPSILLVRHCPYVKLEIRI